MSQLALPQPPSSVKKTTPLPSIPKSLGAPGAPGPLQPLKFSSFPVSPGQFKVNLPPVSTGGFQLPSSPIKIQMPSVGLTSSQGQMVPVLPGQFGSSSPLKVVTVPYNPPSPVSSVGVVESMSTEPKGASPPKLPVAGLLTSGGGGGGFGMSTLGMSQLGQSTFPAPVEDVALELRRMVMRKKNPVPPMRMDFLISEVDTGRTKGLTLEYLRAKAEGTTDPTLEKVEEIVRKNVLIHEIADAGFSVPGAKNLSVDELRRLSAQAKDSKFLHSLAKALNLQISQGESNESLLKRIYEMMSASFVKGTIQEFAARYGIPHHTLTTSLEPRVTFVPPRSPTKYATPAPMSFPSVAFSPPTYAIPKSPTFVPPTFPPKPSQSFQAPTKQTSFPAPTGSLVPPSFPKLPVISPTKPPTQFVPPTSPGLGMPTLKPQAFIPPTPSKTPSVPPFVPPPSASKPPSGQPQAFIPPMVPATPTQFIPPPLGKPPSGQPQAFIPPPLGNPPTFIPTMPPTVQQFVPPMVSATPTMPPPVPTFQQPSGVIKVASAPPVAPVSPTPVTKATASDLVLLAGKLDHGRVAEMTSHAMSLIPGLKVFTPSDLLKGFSKDQLVQYISHTLSPHLSQDAVNTLYVRYYQMA